MKDELYRFAHEAMNCPFEVVIYGHDEKYAHQSALAVFNEIDLLEEKLSRFVAWSDLGRIKVLQPGEFTVVNPETMTCLLTAFWVYKETSGAYDITLGKGMDTLLLDADAMKVGIANNGLAGMVLDLGGIGKGFALDSVADLISKWEIRDFLLSAGGSTVLAVGQNGAEQWSLGINGEQVYLKDVAVSGSGKDVQGEHIIDPRTGAPAVGHERTWAMCPSAAVADALSTAFMVMSKDSVREFCRTHDDIKAYLIEASGTCLTY